MNSKPVEALPEVEADLESAIAHYSTWRSDGRVHVLDKYDETIGWIEWNPDLFPCKIGRVQRAIIKRTYFAVYFLQKETRTLVLAVLDGREQPERRQKLLRSRRKGATGRSSRAKG